MIEEVESEDQYQSQVQQYKLNDENMYETKIKYDEGVYVVKGKQEKVLKDPVPAYSPPEKYKEPTSGKANNKVTINTYNKGDGAWWTKIFPCCSKPEIQPEFQDCNFCQRRVYPFGENQSSDDEPYISMQRMKEREKQPINVFCDRLDNNSLVKTNWD